MELPSDPFNLSEYVLAPAYKQPEKIALAILGPSRAERWSYARLAEAVTRAGGGMLAAGISPGDRLLLRMGNSAHFPIAFLGAIRVGIVPMPTSAALTGPEITRVAESLPPHAILAEPGIALPKIDVPVYGVDILDGPESPWWKTLADELAYVVFTSGTSGRPKPVRHAHRAVWARRMMWRDWYDLRADDRLMHTGAFNWTYTLGTGLLDPWAAGATALVPAAGTDPAMLGLLAKRHDASILAGSPGIFRKLLAHDLPKLPKLRHALSAGEALPPSLRTRWQTATGTDIHEALGMSECSTFLSGSPTWPAPEGCIGYAQTGRQLAVLDDAGEPVADGTPGHLAIHRSDPGLMLGYIEAGGRPNLPLTGAYFVSGDLVTRRPDGAFTYHGRADDVLTAGGFRIAPAEIEAAFDGAPGLTECAALTIQPNPETTLLALAYSGTASEGDLRRFAEPNLARHKHPRAYLRVDALPRGGNGKLDRRALPALVKDLT
ncbi:class I adenylate-forming enzyme family protein [Hasllibacter sp. MH4015]|uniref:class I adenylate-forming enzyme family protein n=1 Tax=Hasllibacter sp. MH4015 TaxID=2854029 RepID=UPI001CD4CC34|nr:class I adenylate-forming enzyme family protein [Hasllibacter sp. MH4015]